MRTPSLRRRVTVSGVAVFAALLVAFDVFVFLTLRDSLESTLEEVVMARADLAHELAAVVPPDELVAQLTAAGVPVVVTTADGRIIEGEPAVTRFQQGPPGRPLPGPQPQVSRTVDLGDGAVAEVFATRAGVDGTLRRVVVLLAMGTALAVLAAVLLFRRSAVAAVGPLEQVAAKAGRTAAGHPGERLEPDNPRTELGRMAVAYDHMVDTLENALEQARAAEERTRRFLDDAAHQLRTPIAAVRASVESLLRASSAEEQDRLLSNVVRETGRTSRVLQDLLAMARLDAGGSPERAPTDLLAICRDEVERAASLAPHLALSLQAPASVGPAPLLEERLVRDAVANLLDNARRHARSRIEVTVAIDGDDLTVAVRDDGHGVPAGAEDLVFERFVSLGDGGGTGLGLPIARSIARSHGGDLTYDDGAFVLRLPHVPAAGPASRTQSQPTG